VDEEIRETILRLLRDRSPGTICPSEAARRVAPERWRAVMDDTRRVARAMVEGGEIEVLQRGEVVDVATTRGPIRLRLRR